VQSAGCKVQGAKCRVQSAESVEHRGSSAWKGVTIASDFPYFYLNSLS